MRQADRQLRGSHSMRGLQCRPATARTHPQARERFVALLAGGGSTGGNALGSGLAATIPPSGNASGSAHLQSSHGTQARCSVVLDVAQWLGVFAVGKVRFARGTARTRPWCAVDHRPLLRSPSREGAGCPIVAEAGLIQSDLAFDSLQIRQHSADLLSKFIKLCFFPTDGLRERVQFRALLRLHYAAIRYQLVGLLGRGAD